MTKIMTNFSKKFSTEMLPVALIAMVFMALFSLFAYSAPETASAQTMCTMDAQQCPDGTWVGRTGPNCEFVCGGDTSDNDGTYTNWPGTEHPDGPPVDAPNGGTNIDPVPGYVDADGTAYYGNDAAIGVSATANTGSNNDGTYTNWPGTEHPDGDNTDENDGTYTNWPGTEHPEDSAEASFGSTVFYSIGNFFSGFFDWFNW